MSASIYNRLRAIPDQIQFFPEKENYIPQFVKDHKQSLFVGGLVTACVFSQCKSLSSFTWMLVVPVTLSMMAVGPWIRQFVKSEGYTDDLYRKDLQDAITSISKIWGSVFSGIAGSYLLEGSISFIQGIYNEDAYQRLKGFKHIILACGILIPYIHEFFLKVDRVATGDEMVIHDISVRMKAIYISCSQFIANPKAFVQNDSKNFSDESQTFGNDHSKKWTQKIAQYLTFDNIFAAGVTAYQIQHQPIATCSGIALGALFQKMAFKYAFAAHAVYFLNKSKQLANRILSVNKNDTSISGYSKRMYLSLLWTTFVMKNGPAAPVVAGLFYSQTLYGLWKNRSL